MPTILEWAEASYPEKYNEQNIHPLEGKSLVPIIEGHQLERSTPLCWEHEMNRAVLMGQWKLVSKGELLDGRYGKWKDYEIGSWELYNMKTDRSELNDLSMKHPEVVNELDSVWNRFAERTGVFPLPWSDQPVFDE